MLCGTFFHTNSLVIVYVFSSFTGFPVMFAMSVDENNNNNNNHSHLLFHLRDSLTWALAFLRIPFHAVLFLAEFFQFVTSKFLGHFPCS